MTNDKLREMCLGGWVRKGQATRAQAEEYARLVNKRVEAPARLADFERWARDLRTRTN